MAIKALIFDMDGVIVDNQQWHFKAWQEFGNRHSINITPQVFETTFGLTNQVIFKLLFGDSISDEETVRLAGEKELIYRKLYRPFIEPVKGLTGFLNHIHMNGIPVALASSAPRENVEFTLQSIQIEKYFSVKTDSTMVTHGKPDPQVYLITAEKLGVPPADCLVFEDSMAGIRAATLAGMEVIGVATTHKPAELLKHVKEIIMNFEAPENLYSKIFTK